MSNPLDELVSVNENGRPNWMVDPLPDPKKRRRILLQVLLFVLTILSTAMSGGWAYSACLILILLFHEMGHYFAARYYGVPATLPYFIPFPYALFGTFGAVIKMQGIIPNRRALFDTGADKGVLVHLRDNRLKLHLHCHRHPIPLRHDRLALG